MREEGWAKMPANHPIPKGETKDWLDTQLADWMRGVIDNKTSNLKMCMNELNKLQENTMGLDSMQEIAENARHHLDELISTISLLESMERFGLDIVHRFEEDWEEWGFSNLVTKPKVAEEVGDEA